MSKASRKVVGNIVLRRTDTGGVVAKNGVSFISHAKQAPDEMQVIVSTGQMIELSREEALAVADWLRETYED